MGRPTRDKAAKWWRFVAGPQPILRLIAFILIAIACLTYLIWQAIEEMPDPCGNDSYNACSVVIERGD